MARARGGFPRKTKSWFGIVGSPHSFTTDDTDFGNGFSVGSTFTIMRMFGEYTISATSAPTALDNCRIGVGIGIVSADAFALGETAAPDPSVEFGYPWLYWRDHPMFFAFTDPDSASASASVRVSYDVKGMRKIRQDQTLAHVIQYQDVVGAPPVTVVMGGTRILLAD